MEAFHARIEKLDDTKFKYVSSCMALDHWSRVNKIPLYAKVCDDMLVWHLTPRQTAKLIFLLQSDVAELKQHAVLPRKVMHAYVNHLLGGSAQGSSRRGQKQKKKTKPHKVVSKGTRKYKTEQQLIWTERYGLSHRTTGSSRAKRYRQPAAAAYATGASSGSSGSG